jgi:GNAT superfamily N-acetyltransferase
LTAVTEKDEPCHLAWLIEPRENEKIQSYFQKRVRPLKADEVLFEFIFTLEEYRGLGIQLWRSKKFTDKSAELGARWALGYIKNKNYLSLKNAAMNAFEPYMVRTDKWRLFCCKSEFKLLAHNE